MTRNAPKLPTSYIDIVQRLARDTRATSGTRGTLFIVLLAI